MNRTFCFVACLLAACGPQARSKQAIGAIVSLSGSLGGKGPERLNAMNLAVEQINASGGTRGMDLELVAINDATDVETGKAAAQELIDRGVQIIIGAMSSGITLAVSDITSAHEILQISGASTSALVTSKQDNGFLFRTCPSDALQGKLLAKRAKAAGLNKVAILHIPGAYGAGLAQTFEAEFSKDHTVTSNTEFATGQTSYKDLLTTVYADKPDGILLVGYAVEGAQVIKDYLEFFASQLSTHWLFPDGLAEPTFWNLVGTSKFTFSHEGTGGAAPSGERYDSFYDRYKASFDAEPNPGIFSANHYDAIMLVALAMASATELTGPSIRDALIAVSQGGQEVSAMDFAAAQQAASKGIDINYEGASGTVDFDSAGDITAPYDVWKVLNGQKTTVEYSVMP